MNTTTSSKFSFYEIVRINIPTEKIDSKSKKINYKLGVVRGKSFDDKGWYYGVFIGDVQEVWSFDEDELESTGKFADPNAHLSGENIRVVVNEKGEGSIKDENSLQE
jgi:hypothetical protein